MVAIAVLIDDEAAGSIGVSDAFAGNDGGESAGNELDAESAGGCDSSGLTDGGVEIGTCSSPARSILIKALTA